MGIVLDGCVILFGGLIGAFFKKNTKLASEKIFGAAIMLLSFVEIIVNTVTIENGRLSSNNIIVIVISVIVGAFLWDIIKLGKIFEKLKIKTKNDIVNTLVFGFIFFGIGGLQITGPVAMAVTGDSSILIMKSMVDFPFALTMGAVYGIGIAVSAFPVVVCQVIIAFFAVAFQNLFSAELVKQISVVGYLILFFSGFNMLFEDRHSVNTMKFMPAFLIIFVFNSLKNYIF